TYYDTLTGANGCDSIIVTELTVNPNKLTGIEAVICEGDSIFAGGAYQTEPGAYFDTLQTSEGCDSIIETDVVMLPSSLENVQASICEGDSFFAGGAFQTQSGTYFDTLANSSGCDSIIITEIIVIPPAISFVSAQICSGDSFFVGGGYQTISGEYVDTLTSAAGCDSIVITDLFVCSLDLQAQSLNVSCFGGNDGSISLSVGGGCSLPYSFSWSNNSSGSSIDSLSAGQYDVTVTESGLGCSATASFEITEPTQILLSGQKTDVTCFGASDGTIDLTVTGGTPEYSYQWSNGSITEDISGLSPGPYSATVTDAAGCTASEGFFVTQPGPLALGGVPTPASCNGASDGAIDLNVLGGIPPYSYSWSTSDTTEDISGLTGGFYTVQVTDLNGCQANVIVQVLEPDALSIEDSTTHESAQGANDGAIDITVSGGTSPYDYRWSTGDTTEDLSGLPAGTYIVTVTDDNGCEISDTIEVEVLPPGQPKPDRFDVSVYPNPFNDHLFVDITSKEADVGYIIITDVLGRKLFTLLIDIQQGENKYQLRMGGILSSGTYVMEVVTGKGNEKVKKVVRE
ncbi:MAG TPA: T9SS type A sorting domain-containing protein, partial [Chitinophagales bacterium]|nr:T9SS type A sorting domain-containing protein [Chitinophagales bacterium]